jgi:hypothetical protein
MVLKDAWTEDVTAKFGNINKTELIINGRMRGCGLQPISTFYSGAELVTYQQALNC